MPTRKIISRKTKKNIRKQKGGASEPPRNPKFNRFSSRRQAIKRSSSVGSMDHGFSRLGSGWSTKSASNLSQKISSLRPTNNSINTLSKNLPQLRSLYNTSVNGARKLKPFNKLGADEQGALERLAQTTGFTDAKQLHSVLGAGRTNLINKLKELQLIRGSPLATASQSQNLARKVRQAAAANAANPKLAAAREAALKAMAIYTVGTASTTGTSGILPAE
jgi:hypothetical protein